MRWLDYNGLNARGFFNLFAKQPNRTTPAQIAAGHGGVLMVGMFLSPSNESKTAARFNTHFEGLALQKDDLVSTNQAEFSSAFWSGTRFVCLDFDGVAYDSTNGVNFTTGTNPSLDYPTQGYRLTTNTVHNTVAYIGTNDPGRIYVSPLASPLDFNGGTEVDSGGLGCIGTRADTGVMLAVGFGTNPNVWKSTDGGTTWAMVGSPGFVDSGVFVGYGATQWLTIGTQGSSPLYFSVSTDDGTTWSAPQSMPSMSGNVFASGAIATDGAGNWVAIGLGAPPDNYWVSTDDGSSWISPNLFAAGDQFGVIPGLLTWDGAKWCAVFSNSDFSANFVSTSTDGQNWDVGPIIIDTP